MRTLLSVRYGKVRAHAVTLPEAVELILDRASSGMGGFVLTPNVDHIAIAQHNEELADAYRHAFLALADGVPLVALSRLLRLPVRHKVSGSDLFEPLVRRCAAEGVPIYFLGATDVACAEAGHVLRQRYAMIEIAGINTDAIDPERDPDGAALALRRARASGAKVIFVNLPPRKQVLMHRFSHEYYPAVALGTGSAVAFFAGVVKRAPRWVSRVGLEWLYRIMQEPGRLWRRYLIDDMVAVPVFAAMARDRLRGRPLVDEERWGAIPSSRSRAAAATPPRSTANRLSLRTGPRRPAAARPVDPRGLPAPRRDPR